MGHDLVVQRTRDRQHDRRAVTRGASSYFSAWTRDSWTAAEPGVHLERAPLRVVRLQPPPLLLELLGDAEPDAEREPDVVQRLEPGQGLVLGQLDAAARLGQRVQHLLGGLVLGAAQRGLGVPAELPGRLRVVAVAVRQQPGQHRVLRRLVRPRPVHARHRRLPLAGVQQPHLRAHHPVHPHHRHRRVRARSDDERGRTPPEGGVRWPMAFLELPASARATAKGDGRTRGAARHRPDGRAGRVRRHRRLLGRGQDDARQPDGGADAPDAGRSCSTGKPISGPGPSAASCSRTTRCCRG